MNNLENIFMELFRLKYNALAAVCTDSFLSILSTMKTVGSFFFRGARFGHRIEQFYIAALFANSRVPDIHGECAVKVANFKLLTSIQK
jgi:hypothetical protein